MEQLSLWQVISEKPIHFPQLTQDIEVDVAIIGGGITGITAALELIQAGKKVAILEAHTMGGVTTSHSTGNLYVPVQPLFQRLVQNFGIKIAGQVARARADAIDYIEQNTQEFKIPCQFTRRPWYLYSSDEQQIKTVLKEFEILKQLNVEAQTVKDLPFDLTFKTAFRILDQARFNPLQYVQSLSKELEKKGCLIFEKTQVIEIQEDKIQKLLTDKGKVTAQQVIMATHTPIGIKNIQFFIAPYRSYVLGVQLEDGIYPECNLWDLGRPYNAISTHAMGGRKPDILTIAGSHHKVGQGQPTTYHFKELEGILQKQFFKFEIIHQWSAQHYHAADGLPYIGKNSKNNLFMATGYFADGLVYGTIAGQLIATEILRKTKKTPYSINRFNPLASMKFLIKENLNVLCQYAQDVPILKAPNLKALKAGKGKIIEVNQEKIAVCRDNANKLHKVSAVCPHMKCIVDWNEAEQTWDCPCHGSRFKATGEWIEGPAMSGLKKMD